MNRITYKIYSSRESSGRQQDQEESQVRKGDLAISRSHETFSGDCCDQRHLSLKVGDALESQVGLRTFSGSGNRYETHSETLEDEICRHSLQDCDFSRRHTLRGLIQPETHFPECGGRLELLTE